MGYWTEVAIMKICFLNLPTDLIRHPRFDDGILMSVVMFQGI